MRITIPINLRDNEETLIVEYEENRSPYQSGFDALNVPFSINHCIGYPTIHAFFQDMNAVGYKRYCGFIQFVQTIRQKQGTANDSALFVDVDEYFHSVGNPYFSYGYPASLYDAPCHNLGDCDYLEWSAFTYLVDMPTRMNHHKLSYIKGFSWGYEEDETGCVKIQDFKLVSKEQFSIHHQFLLKQFPNFRNGHNL